MNLKIPNSLHEAIILFADPDVCHNFLTEIRWPGGAICQKCGSQEVGFVKTRRIWNCKDCKKQFSAKTGTIFEESPLPLSTWLPAVWLITNAKNGISSCELARAMAVTQKTAWFMLHRIREAMANGSFEKFVGTVEADETYIGGKESNKHANKKLNQGRGSVGKAAVFALLERGKSSRVKAKHVQDTTLGTLQNEIGKNVRKLSNVYTDDADQYYGLMDKYWHESVNHSSGEYVRGEVHTNGLENWFTLFKRCYKGTWTHLSDEHLQRYLNEQEFRFDNRKDSDGERFSYVMAQVSGKRLNYKELIGKEE